MANLTIQILAGVPDCIHANEGYAYPKPAVQLTEGISAYSVSPSIATYTQGNAIKYSSLEESAYTSVTPGPIIKQTVYSSPVVTKSFLPSAPIVTNSYLPPAPVITKSYLPPVATAAPYPYASVAPVITKSYLPPVGPVAYTAPLSKVATYTPTSNIVSIPAIKSLEYQYPKVSTGYHAASVAYVLFFVSNFNFWNAFCN